MFISSFSNSATVSTLLMVMYKLFHASRIDSNGRLIFSGMFAYAWLYSSQDRNPSQAVCHSPFTYSSTRTGVERLVLGSRSSKFNIPPLGSLVQTLRLPVCERIGEKKSSLLSSSITSGLSPACRMIVAGGVTSSVSPYMFTRYRLFSISANGI